MSRARIIFLPLAAFEVDEESITNVSEVVTHAQLDTAEAHTFSADNYLQLSALRLGVDEVRTVNDFASLRSAFGTDKLLVIVALAITPEAQNALLKNVEDVESLRTVIIVPQTARILPTLLSRCQVERPKIITENAEAVEKWASEMLKATLPARQKKAETLIKKSENHVIKSHMIALVSAARSAGRPAHTMNRALQLLSYSEQTGASHKLLLDALCLII